MTAQWAIWTLLWIGVGASLIGAIGVLTADDAMDRLHYIGPIASVGVPCVAAAVVIQEATSQAGLKAILIGLIMLFMNPILTHATARAIRVHREGHLMPRAEERIPFLDEPGFVGEGESQPDHRPDREER